MNVRNIVLALCLLIGLCSVAASAQSPAKPLKTGALSQLASRQTDAPPFILLTPADLKTLSLLAVGDPCDTAVPINFGQTINGSLTSSDCQLDDNSYADFYIFNGTQGQQVTINLGSGAFDTFLGLSNMSGTFVIGDDDGGGGTNSRIIATLPETGQFVIMANSAFPNSFGPYTLNLAGSTPCTFSIDPTSAQIPGIGGTFSFNLTTQPGCQWGAVTPDWFITINNNNGQGSAAISYTIGGNTSGTTRVGTITVGGQVFTITQPSIDCTYSISPSSANISPDGGTFEFMMNTPQGCPWTAQYNNFWIWTTNEVRYGPGPVVYTVQPNNGSDRTGTITTQGHTFTITQTGRNCTYSVSPTSFQLSAAGTQNGQFVIDTQPGCTWGFSSFTGGFNYVYMPDGHGGVGPGTKNFIAWPNATFNVRTWTIEFNGLSPVTISFTQRGAPYRTLFDYFGDSKADVGVFRPSTGEWILGDSWAPSMVYRYNFGLAGDIAVPADYNGDRYTDLAVFRPGNSTWYFLDRASGNYSAVQFGAEGDIPAPADFDGDGKADLAIFRPSNGLWFIWRSGDGGYTITTFGMAGDSPVPADYDGDGRADIAIWRASVGEWWYSASSSGAVFAAQFGTSTDRALPGDYTGDGKADIAIWRPSNGFWYILRSEDLSYFAFPFGMEGDIPVPADYDADGLIDASVFRPSDAVWYINRSGSTVTYRQFGQTGDVPLPSVYVR